MEQSTGYTASSPPVLEEYTGPGRCEHERVWETRCARAVTTVGEKEMVYRAYTCAMHFCKYPEIYCRVKGHGILLK